MHSLITPLTDKDIEEVLAMLCKVDNFLTSKKKNKEQQLLHSALQINWSLWECEKKRIK